MSDASKKKKSIKKGLILVIPILIVILSTVGINLSINSGKVDNSNQNNSNNDNKKLAIYLENESGEYELSSDRKFPKDGYVLDTEKTACKNGGVVTQDPTTKSINASFSKADSCNLYFKKEAKKGLAAQISQSILKGSTPSSDIIHDGTPNFKSIATTDEGIYAMEDDYGTSYYYRGAVTNNYVKFGKWNQDLYFGYLNTTADSKYRTFNSLDECNSDSTYNKNCKLGISKGTDMYWRIIRINGDGSLRIIYDGDRIYQNGESDGKRFALSEVEWNSTEYKDVKYVGYMYGGANGVSSTKRVNLGETGYEDSANSIYNETSSNVKTKLEEWYKTNIYDNGLDDYVSDNIFCNDRTAPGKDATGFSNDTGLGYGLNKTVYGPYARLDHNSTATSSFIPSPQLKCPNKNDSFTKYDNKGNAKLNQKVGLITADEALMAGSSVSGTIANTQNKDYYLYKYDVTWYWTMSPHGHRIWGALQYFVYSSGLISDNHVSYAGGVCPVINLTPEYVSKMSGDGSSENPYVLSE